MREKETAWHGFHPSVLVCFRRFIPGRAGTAHQKKRNARPDGFISHDCSAVPRCCCFFKTSRAMWFGCGAPAEHEKLGNSARFLCGCCVACCDLRVRTHLRTHKGQSEAGDTIAKTARTQRLPTRPSRNAHVEIQAEPLCALLSTRSVSADEEKKKMLRHRRVQQAQELEEAEASRGGVPPADTHSASAGSLSLHDTYCFMFFFLILSPLSVLPRHLLWPCGPSSAKRNIGQDSVCVRDFDCV